MRQIQRSGRAVNMAEYNRPNEKKSKLYSGRRSSGVIVETATANLLSTAARKQKPASVAARTYNVHRKEFPGVGYLRHVSAEKSTCDKHPWCELSFNKACRLCKSTEKCEKKPLTTKSEPLYLRDEKEVKWRKATNCCYESDRECLVEGQLPELPTMLSAHWSTKKEVSLKLISSASRAFGDGELKAKQCKRPKHLKDFPLYQPPESDVGLTGSKNMQTVSSAVHKGSRVYEKKVHGIGHLRYAKTPYPVESQENLSDNNNQKFTFSQ